MDEREQDIIKYVLKIGYIYGYGNLIAHLKAEWIKSLMKNSEITYEQAKLAADAEPLEGGEE